jgi:3-hydroxyacyl-[acyl-carrier-protein] dehydratase
MLESSDTEAIRERVKQIVRRDLKLGDAPIPDDMPFFQSEADLDSLDILLLVGSIEREFGLKIASEDVGRAVFENVGTLTEYVQKRTTGRNAPPAVKSAAPAPPPVDVASYLSRLPHAEPFRFVSEVTSVREGESAEGAWNLRGDEAFFAGHFPGRPIVPGVLVAEALAQLSGLVAGRSAGAASQGALVHVDVRFEQAVTPPARIMLRSRLLRTAGSIHQFAVWAGIGDQPIATGALTLHLTAEPTR